MSRASKLKAEISKQIVEMWTKVQQLDEEDFPVGAPVSWLDAGRTCTGVVVGHSKMGIWVEPDSPDSPSFRIAHGILQPVQKH